MELSLAYVKGACWRIWNDYFQTQDSPIPQVHFVKAGSAHNEGIFVSPIDRKTLHGFLTATQNNTEMQFSEIGMWALKERDWFGEWTVFVCRPCVLSYNSQRTGKRR